MTEVQELEVEDLYFKEKLILPTYSLSVSIVTLAYWEVDKEEELAEIFKS